MLVAVSHNLRLIGTSWAVWYTLLNIHLSNVWLVGYHSKLRYAKAAVLPFHLSWIPHAPRSWQLPCSRLNVMIYCKVSGSHAAHGWHDQ